MWLVLEGIDGAGKTTLANKLIQQHPEYVLQHVGPPNKKGPWTPSSEVHVGGSFKELASAWASFSGLHVIWDRGHLGNWVYQTEENRMSVGQMRLLEALLMNHNGLTCVLNTDPKTSWDRHSGDRLLGDLYTEAIAFQQACNELKSYWVANGALSVETLFNDWQRYDDVRHLDSEGVGSNVPTYWLLGEQLNPKAGLQVPFSTEAGMQLIWPWVNPMSMRVSNALEPEDNLEESRLNNFNQKSIERLYFRWSTLDRPRVVTFGGTAMRACKAAGVKVALELDHPQSIWRFKNGEASEWAAKVAQRVGMVA